MHTCCEQQNSGGKRHGANDSRHRFYLHRCMCLKCKMNHFRVESSRMIISSGFINWFLFRYKLANLQFMMSHRRNLSERTCTVQPNNLHCFFEVPMKGSVDVRNEECWIVTLRASRSVVVSFFQKFLLSKSKALLM